MRVPNYRPPSHPGEILLNRVHLENCSSFHMKRKTLIPQPLLPILPEAEPEKSPSPYWERDLG